MPIPLTMALGGLQAGMGIIQSIGANSRMKRLRGQRKAYETPEEYLDILQATQMMAQQGFDASTLSYLTNQGDRAFSSAVGAATRLGANPNDLSNILDLKLQNSFKIGAENHRLNMENFSKYLSAVDVIGQNKAAEWKSQQDFIKDDMQAAAAEKAAGVQNIAGGINAGISSYASQQTSQLYKQMAEAFKAMKRTGGAAGTTTAGYGADFDNYMMD